MYAHDKLEKKQWSWPTRYMIFQLPKLRKKLAKKHILCSTSSEVIAFGTNQKRVCNFLFVINRNLGLISHRFWDTATYSIG